MSSNSAEFAETDPCIDPCLAGLSIEQLLFSLATVVVKNDKTQFEKFINSVVEEITGRFKHLQQQIARLHENNQNARDMILNLVEIINEDQTIVPAAIINGQAVGLKDCR